MIPRSLKQNPHYDVASMSEPPLVAIYVYRHSKPVEILQMEKRLPKLLVSLGWLCCCHVVQIPNIVQHVLRLLLLSGQSLWLRVHRQQKPNIKIYS